MQRESEINPGGAVDTPTLEPLTIKTRYPEPRGAIDPDKDKGWIRRLTPLLRPQRTTFFWALFAGVIGLFLQVGTPAVAREAIDNSVEGADGNLEVYVVILLAMAVGLLVVRAAYRYLLFTVAYDVETDLRGLIYRHLTELSHEFYDRTSSGEIISRANSDIRSIQVLLAFGPLALLSVLTFVVAFIVMLTIHVPLTLVALSTMPFVYTLGQQLRNIVFPLSWVTSARLADVATIVDENINGTRVIKSFAAEKRQVDQLADAAERLRWSSVETIKARARFNPIIEALPQLGIALVLLYGGWLAIDGQVSIGTLLQFNAYVIIISFPFRMFGFILMQSQRAAAAAARIYQILDEQPVVVDAVNARSLGQVEGQIEFRDVRFAYPTVADAAPVLDGFSMTIEAGETVAIVGRTGSGKSTVARLLPRFYDVDAGAVVVDGNDVRDLTQVSLRHNIGLVLDEPFLFSQSIADNIAFGRPDATRADVVEAATAAQAHEFIEELSNGYDTVIGERGYTLSGGQRQRLSLARTLLVAPRILVLDDATSAIDVGVEAKIHAALEGVLHDRTTIVIAHRLSTISLADRVIVLDAGGVHATGTHAELLESNSLYQHILTAVDDGSADEDDA